MKHRNKRVPRPRNIAARALASPLFRQRVKPSAKAYKRNKRITQE